MQFDERAPTPTNPWTLNSLPIVVGWIDDEDRPAVLSGPQSTSDPWVTRRAGLEHRPRRGHAGRRQHRSPRRQGGDAAPTGSHRTGPWLALDARRHGPTGRVPVRARHRRARRAARHGRGAGPGRRPGRGPRARPRATAGARPRGRPGHDGAAASPAQGDDAAVVVGPVRGAPGVAGASPIRPRPDRRRVSGDGLSRAACRRGRDGALVQRSPMSA